MTETPDNRADVFNGVARDLAHDLCRIDGDDPAAMVQSLEAAVLAEVETAEAERVPLWTTRMAEARRWLLIHAHAQRLAGMFDGPAPEAPVDEAAERAKMGLDTAAGGAGVGPDGPD